MTVHSFPNKPIRNPARELGVSDIPVPPLYALRDMDKAKARFVAALVCDASAGLMPPETANQAQMDRQSFPTLVRFANIEGVQIVETGNLNKFVHYVTGYPMAWVLAWQLHAYAGSLTGLALDRDLAIPAFAQHVQTAAKAFEAGFNREL